jgi:CheY-like chemotaxis protein
MASSHQLDHAPCVLVAEDDELTCMLIVDALTEPGFTVIEAGCGEEARRILRSHAESLDALFTDINMPGSLDGVELARRTRCNLPRLGVVIGSGEVVAPAGRTATQEPFSAKTLIMSAASRIAFES